MPTRNAEVEAIAAVLERVKGAKGPDRRLDYELFVAFADSNASNIWDPREGHFYTASIDAALALVERVLPTGWWIQLRFGSDFMAEAWCERPGRRSQMYNGENPALAILAALLSAKLAFTQETAHEHG